MAPVEFEKELKKRLRSREVRPSKDSWDRIAERLDAEGPGRRRKPRWWLGLAAASLVFLAGLVFFWERPQPLPDAIPVVEASREEAPVLEAKQETQSNEGFSIADQTGVALTGEAQASESSDPGEVPEPEVAGAALKEDAIASLEVPVPVKDPVQVEDPDRLLDSGDAGIAGVDPASTSVDDAEIDSLLREAQQAIAGQEEAADQPSVDPSLLLSQVEDELDQTFREKIMEKVKSGVTRLRSAVAQNNK